MAEVEARTASQHWGGTERRDAWWLEILPVVIVLGGFGIYATWRAFEGRFYEWGPYLSPFYSPLIDPHHHWWPLSPALLILAGPLGFRATCYYYRKAYYRAFFLDPPGCAVSEEPEVLPGRELVSFHSAKPSPLVSIPCGGVSLLSLVGRHSRFLVSMEVSEWAWGRSSCWPTSVC